MEAKFVLVFINIAHYDKKTLKHVVEKEKKTEHFSSFAARFTTPAPEPEGRYEI